MTAPLPKLRCPRCGEDKLVKRFPPGKRTRACLDCRKTRAHRSRVEAVYGLAPGEYDRLLRRQDGRCAICGNRPRRKRLAVDHNHRTGRVRGLLCSRCNHDLLGGAHDTADLLRRALAYLEADEEAVAA